MDEAGDMAALAIPFAAGSAAGQLATRVSGPVSWFLPGIVLGFVTLLFPFLFSGRRPRLRYGVLFFLLGVFCQCSQVLLPVPPPGPPTLPEKACEALKRLIASLPFPHGRSAGMIQALMTGDRSGLDRETITAFRSSGASHILALSGLHLGMIYLIVRRLFGLLGNTPAARKARCAVTLAATGFYMLMTGAGPSVVRAFLYVCVSEAASLDSGRKKDPARILLAALTIQLALKPSVIAGVGFQLSYLAMLGITLLLPRLQAWYPAPRTRLEKADPMRRIWNAAAMTISCQVFTAPLAWIRFHTFPKYFLLTNLLSLPLSGAVMLVSVSVLTLAAAGICPYWLVRADDALIEALLFVLETISSL
ncbi:MAG: ComEC/Rec2 family competence protein [Bacteroidales bacterium]|nr:ComEC/Rec2 family competence protein [Bacteroidales bacterium]